MFLAKLQVFLTRNDWFCLGCLDGVGSWSERFWDGIAENKAHKEAAPEREAAERGRSKANGRISDKCGKEPRPPYLGLPSYSGGIPLHVASLREASVRGTKLRSQGEIIVIFVILMNK